MKHCIWGIIGLVFLLLAEAGWAAFCTDTFPSGVQGHPRANPQDPASDERVQIECGSRIIGSGTVLRVDQVFNPFSCAVDTCGTADCQSGGSVVPEIVPTFQASNGSSGNVTVANNATVTIGGTNNALSNYNSVTVGTNATLNFSTATSGTTTYRINSLFINNDTIINLQPGDYYINTLTRNGTSGTAVFNVLGTGTARVYILNDFTTARAVNWNPSGPASKLFIYSFHNFTVGATTIPTTQIKAVMYVANDLLLTNVNFTGAMAPEDLYLSGNSTVTYDSTAVPNMDFGSFCTFPPAVTKFNVNAPANGTNCQNMTITVTAQNSSNQTVTNYTGAITIDTQSGSGTWVSTAGGGTFSGGTSNGIATYQFVAGDQGIVTFQLNYPAGGSAPITIKAYQTNNATIAGLSGTVNFIPTSFLVTDTVVSNPPNPPPPAFSTPQIAGNNFTMFITAYNPSNCGIITSYIGAKTLRFWTSYINPTSGTINATINGTAIANSVGATQTTQSITFTNGVATVTGRYNDAGQLTLNVQDTSSGGPSGMSGNFVVKPAQFAINIPSNSASQVTSPPAAAQSACLANAVFAKAGNNFTVNIQPQTSQGFVTPNYGNETAPEGILLSSSALVAPTGGRNGSNNNGAIGNGSAFTKITGSAGPFAQAPYFTGSTFSFDEVGCIVLTASVGDGNYLGAGNVLSSVVVGRFTPDHFDASGNIPLLTTKCSTASGSFTYLDQPFLYGTSPILTVAARSLGGTTTQNYTGSFWRLSNTALGNVYNKQYYPVNGTDIIPALIFSAVNPPPGFIDGGNGSGTFTFSDGGGFKIQRQNGTLVSPFTAEIQLRIATIIDSDGVFCTNGCTNKAFNFGATTVGTGINFTGINGGKQFYHGRMVLVDSVGSELLTLTMPMQAQYYTSGGNGFAINALDSCTTLLGGVSNLILTPASGITTTPSLSSNTFNQGNINISLTPPNVSGYVDIEANLTPSGANLPWLQFNWPYAGSTNGAFTASPRGRATFGVFRGNDRIIYEKEIFQ